MASLQGCSLVSEPAARAPPSIQPAEEEITSPQSCSNEADTIIKTAGDSEPVTKRVSYLADSKHNPENPDRWAESQGGSSAQERQPGFESCRPDEEGWRRTGDQIAGEEGQPGRRGGGGNREFRTKNRQGSFHHKGPKRGNTHGWGSFDGGNIHGRGSFDGGNIHGRGGGFGDGRRDSESGRRSTDSGRSWQDEQHANSKYRQDSQMKRASVQFSPPDGGALEEVSLVTQDSDGENPEWMSDPKSDI
jgi:hypothetical protein